MPDFARMAQVLNKVANHMASDPSLDAYSALSLVVFGDRAVNLSDRDEYSPEAQLWEESESQLIGWDADVYNLFDPLPLDEIPRERALVAAREAAERCRGYVR